MCFTTKCRKHFLTMGLVDELSCVSVPCDGVEMVFRQHTVTYTCTIGLRWIGAVRGCGLLLTIPVAGCGVLVSCAVW